MDSRECVDTPRTTGLYKLCGTHGGILVGRGCRLPPCSPPRRLCMSCRSSRPPPPESLEARSSPRPLSSSDHDSWTAPRCAVESPPRASGPFPAWPGTSPRGVCRRLLSAQLSASRAQVLALLVARLAGRQTDLVAPHAAPSAAPRPSRQAARSRVGRSAAERAPRKPIRASLRAETATGCPADPQSPETRESPPMLRRRRPSAPDESREESRRTKPNSSRRRPPEAKRELHCRT
mmetsp:Transcript_14190/g.53324  ORF Transcript_14190/g.53324 Transcript_14190/m.53324 type:complete len:235 (-) Transcript_14190:218-922(-)